MDPMLDTGIPNNAPNRVMLMCPNPKSNKNDRHEEKEHERSHHHHHHERYARSQGRMYCVYVRRSYVGNRKRKRDNKPGWENQTNGPPRNAAKPTFWERGTGEDKEKVRK